jgi:hypothetical protein
VPAGFVKDPENDRTVTTLGGMWKPLLNIAVKVDYQINRSGAGEGANQLNVSLGYLF